MVNVVTLVCRYDAMMSRMRDSQSVDVASSVADCSATGNLSHTKQCIIDSDLSADVTSVCGVLLPRIHAAGTKVFIVIVAIYGFVTTYMVLGGGLAQLVTSLVASTKLINAGPG